MTMLTMIMTIILRSCYMNGAFHWDRWVRLHTPIRLLLQIVRSNVWEFFKENDTLHYNFGFCTFFTNRIDHMCSWLTKNWSESSVFHRAVVEVHLYTDVTRWHYLSIIALFIWLMHMINAWRFKNYYSIFVSPMTLRHHILPVYIMY